MGEKKKEKKDKEKKEKEKATVRSAPDGSDNHIFSTLKHCPKVILANIPSPHLSFSMDWIYGKTL